MKKSFYIFACMIICSIGTLAADYSATKGVDTSIKTIVSGQYTFSSNTLFFTGPVERIRFDLTGSAAFYKTGKNRLSLATFTLKAANGTAIALAATDFTGNNIHDFTNLVDGKTTTFCNAAWSTEATANDYFEIALPEGTDLQGGFSFSFITENTTMNPTAFDVILYSSTGEVAFTEKSYTITISGTSEPVKITYKGQSYSADDNIKTTDEITADDITATEIQGYTYSVNVSGTTISIVYTPAEIISNPPSVAALLDRIGGEGTSSQIETELDPSMNSRQDIFTISAKEGKPFVKGNSLCAITAGIGWYLNHYLNVNIAWNNLNECGDGAYTELPSMVIPTEDETHTCDAKYRYYLNYCTYGYSMATWSTARWMKEIDWMALHGVNMPLAIIGLEQVWKDFLMKDLTACGANSNYTETEAENFIPGPAYIGWWAMNNLQGWGGDKSSDPSAGMHDNAWYKRQVTLGQAILERERQLGMQPVLPGFCGMVPTNFTTKTGIATSSTNNWNNFVRPYILDPSSEAFPKMAAKYYERLKSIMGESKYYSMDPFHEYGYITSGKYAEGYKACYDAMNTNCGDSTLWVIQQWEWQDYQKCSLTSVPAGKMLVLDLFSDGKPAFDSYSGYAPQKAIYCIIPNFGGRSGLMGRLESVAGNYFANKAKYSTIQGIGAAPEAIEQTPITYDLLFELPWLGAKPDIQTWVNEYSKTRYGVENYNAQIAWDELRQSALAFGTDAVQGPIEDVWAARPNLTCSPVSYWGKTISNVSGTYTKERRQMVADASYKLIDASSELQDNKNLDYDLIEVGGQALADYAYSLLSAINDAKTGGETAKFNERKTAFLQLILDVDSLKGTNTNFRVGKWTQEARSAAGEIVGASLAKPDWYEQANARTLITTWGDYATSESTPLHDYSYRSWNGMLKDFYYPRWEYFFSNNCSNPTNGWFYHDWDWAHSKVWKVSDSAKSTTALAEGAAGYSYSAEAKGNTADVALAVLSKYIVPVEEAGETVYKYRYVDSDCPTGIDDIRSSNVTNGSTGGTYTISDLKISGANGHGIFIINGKKVIK